MPTYSYQCQKCETVRDVFHSMSATPRLTCESCGSRRMKRLLGTGAGIIFKGSGFY
ncbi:MAG: zinc ribbon domain-containing protein, partial [Candidatus Hydrogenedentes bacterium]|nr:zinc ribbon domain-containing protein [Candidatus Hydrogenedentota bacterium]